MSRMMHPPSNDAEAAGPIYVIWDMKRFPVLNDYCARRVGPCVRLYLRKLGYSGPITISAVGELSKVPEVPEAKDILEAVFSTGISLYNSFKVSTDVTLLLFDTPCPSNVLLIATPVEYCFTIKNFASKTGINFICPFLVDYNENDDKYTWEKILSDPEGDSKCSESVEPASWNCAICYDVDSQGLKNVVGQGFKNFMTHLSSQEHDYRLQRCYPMKGYVHLDNDHQSFEDNDEGEGFEDNDDEEGFEDDEEEEDNDDEEGFEDDEEEGFEDSSDLAAISVFWDILTCPVPLVYDDARGVSWSIKRYLRNLGYSGPTTITAVGELSKVPEDILEAVSSTGISLFNTPYGPRDMFLLLIDCSIDNPPPAKIMVLSIPPNFSDIIHYLEVKGRNLVLPFPLDSSLADAKYLWEKFLMADPGELEDDKCSESVEPTPWNCAVCDDVAGQGFGFENFRAHLSSQEHKREVVEAIVEPEKANEEEKAGVSPHEKISGGVSSALAVISVFWDILSCPVPRGCDARLVGPCIIWYLRNLGYSGRISITAFGKLPYTPVMIREAFSSTGISLLNRPFDPRAIVRIIDQLLYARVCARQCVVVITSSSRKFTILSRCLAKKGCNVISLFPVYYNEGDVMRLWKKILSDPEGAKCSETVEANVGFPL